MEPVPPPDAHTYSTDPRISTVQASVDKLRGSTLEHMHWVNAGEPEECVWGFIDAVSMLGQAASMCMPQWRRFLTEEDLIPAYESSVVVATTRTGTTVARGRVVHGRR
jgi:hypothetical protein